MTMVSSLSFVMNMYDPSILFILSNLIVHHGTTVTELFFVLFYKLSI